MAIRHPREIAMQRTENGASCERLQMALGTILLGFLVLYGCDCQSRQPGSIAPSRAQRASRRNGNRRTSPQAGRSLREMPASDVKSAYGLPLDITIEAPEVPPRIKGPTPDVKKILSWFGL